MSANPNGRGYGGRGQFRGQRGQNKNRRGSEKRGNEQNGAQPQGAEKKPKEENEKKEIIYMPRTRKIELSGTNLNDVLIVCFDIETAEGSELSEIYQIGAISSAENKILVNMLPNGKIHWGVTKYSGTNVTVEVKDGKKELWHTTQKKVIPTVSPIEGWKIFMTWLENLKKKSSKKVIFMSHGSLDPPCLLNNLEHYGHLDDFLKLTDGFCDSLPILNNRLVVAFERMFPDEAFEAHNALGDAEALYKILHKRSHFPDSTEILLNEEILENTIGIQDTLAYARFRVSKQAQNAKPPGGIYFIKSLVNVENLFKVTFKNQFSDDKTVPKLVNFDQNVALIAIDVQLMNSQGERSEIVQISAKNLQNNLEFSARCYGTNEKFLAEDPKFVPVLEGLQKFDQWLETHFADKNIILVAFKIHHKIWPSLVNHLYFYQIWSLLAKIQGLCDLRFVIGKHDKSLKNLENLQNNLAFVHKQLFKESIEIYKSKEVLDSTQKIVQHLAKDKPIEKLFEDCIEEPLETLGATKVKLDKSLSEDISKGKDFPQGHIGNFRMPADYLNSMLNTEQESETESGETGPVWCM